MVDFSIPNICGASPELNDVLSKLADAKADAKAKLDEAASTAAAAFGEAQNELAGLKDKLQSIEIPTLPKLNLQAEIAGLASQIPGTPSFLSALAKMKIEFGDDIKSAGLELDSLVSDATKAILGGGDICALVPNLEKDAGSNEPAVQKPIAPKQAAVPAVTEAASVSNDNANVAVTVAENKEKTESYKVTKTLPTKDTGSFVVATETKKISVKETVITVSTDKKSNVATKEAPFMSERKWATERLSISNVEISGDSLIIKNLKHKPTFVKTVYVHPTANEANAKLLVLPKDDLIKLGRKIATKEEWKAVNAAWQKEKKPPYYRSRNGPHMAEIYPRQDTMSRGKAASSPSISSDGSVTILSPDIIPKSNHPGNIKGVVTYKLPFLKPGEIVEAKRWRNNYGNSVKDSSKNIKFRGYAVYIKYEYLNIYKPEVDPEPPTPTEDPAAVAAAIAVEDAKEEAWLKTPEGIAYTKSEAADEAQAEAEFAAEDAAFEKEQASRGLDGTSGT
jgi:hypothetical protein